jgi:hypothetical protein
MKTTKNDRACIAWRVAVEKTGEGYLLMRRTRTGGLIVYTDSVRDYTYRLGGTGYDKVGEALEAFLGIPLDKAVANGKLHKVLDNASQKVWRYRLNA